MAALPASNSITQTISAPDGATTTYWLIHHVIIAVDSMTLEAQLSGYLSPDAHASGNTPSDIRSVTLSGVALAGVVAGGGALLTTLANWIVANSADFLGGTVN